MSLFSTLLFYVLHHEHELLGVDRVLVIGIQIVDEVCHLLLGPAHALGGQVQIFQGYESFICQVEGLEHFRINIF